MKLGLREPLPIDRAIKRPKKIFVIPNISRSGAELAIVLQVSSFKFQKTSVGAGQTIAGAAT
ncbi:MAG: hypothetical protein PHV70_09755, partial [Desulfobacteraceae bacterium]|nr:hypothetical protein [Desulfobacteraceae bacterium]